ncbi:hypothetical protein A3K34_02320 [candidate division WWE3 bacterium RIFOXYC1_FULL_40_10]|uniref:Uncharacterized protein n=1 Tax=candidate division WWE3 bacterium RIFOXYA2_FULL_46_9 TaxID=1802636 RepID=A0A1F4VYR8_UNCKA|nr:MAG: hypothetical protein A3K58_02320 [candidate division WWE3 bacterium RIFOXYB1_FULL_40_22]OGC61689.1 MAG: hypothetical protein A3K37_02320 [candidate division WWE3 bacterium RIFOXYA1_FULL_40_11]OGC62326.1 MAG: hypothetical protein A2264_02050 [candidate division WWE3 bacterium RIFOXYA2_FULL_46_9]OGC64864.1 MAG: hypothetical protein A2326_01145 [candidate division WWE3 bacterium RIFOXYB2_FULL_41_6]OGC66072.1 MAG: hypothetical protein A3K34_02320 [candidate division WWE3 bacterium RIFOXYC1_
MNDLIISNYEERNKQLLEDCISIWVEHDFQSRWFRVKGYHELGKRLLEEPKEYGDRFVPLVAESLGKSERTIYRTIEFARAFPDLDLLPEGKNISWYKIIQKYLPLETRCIGDAMLVYICPNCNSEHKKSDIKFIRKNI